MEPVAIIAFVSSFACIVLIIIVVIYTQEIRKMAKNMDARSVEEKNRRNGEYMLANSI